MTVELLQIERHLLRLVYLPEMSCLIDHKM